MSAGVAIAVAATLLGLAVASGPFAVSSAGSALLRAELDTVGADQLTLLGVTAGDVTAPATVRRIDGLLRAQLAANDLPAPTVQVVLDLETATDPPRRVVLLGREGASTNLPATVEGADGPFAVPAGSAARLGGIGAGEAITLQDRDGATSVVAVGPVVEEFQRGDVPTFWQPVSGMLTALDDPRFPPPPPALLAEPDPVLAVLDDLVGHDARPGAHGAASARAIWTVPFTEEPTLEAAQALLPSVTALRATVVDPTTELGGLLATGGVPGRVTGQQVDAALARVERATVGLAVPVRALAWAGQALALVGVAVATVLGGRRQLSRARLWLARGVSAPVTGLRWAVLAAVPITIGLAAGWALAWLGTEMLGPGGTIDPSVLRAVWRPLTLAALAALATVLFTITGAHLLAARERGGGSLPPVAEGLAVVAAGFALWQVDRGGQAITVDVEGTLRLDALTVALPLLLVVATALVGTRLLATIARHGLCRGPSRGAWYLAARRLRATGGAALALVAVTASALGLLVVATTLASSADATVEEQVGLLLGADAILSLSRAEGVSAGPEVEEMGLPATRVRRAPESLLDGDRLVDVLAVDPTSFADVAFEPRRLGRIDVRGLTTSLTSAGSGPLPAVLVGASLPGIRQLHVGGVDLTIEQVATAPVFPGANGARPTVVIADGGPLVPDDRATASRLAVAVYPELWVAGGGLPAAELRQHLEQVTMPATGVGPGATGPREFVLAADRRTDPGLTPARWSFAYLRGQATVLAALAVAGLLAHHRAVQRQRALADALVGRMGLGERPRTVAAATELALVLGAAVVLALGAGMLGARVVLDDYAPLPEVALPVAFVPPLHLLEMAVPVGAIAVVLTVLAGRRAAARTDVAALLRGGA